MNLKCFSCEENMNKMSEKVVYLGEKTGIMYINDYNIICASSCLS